MILKIIIIFWKLYLLNAQTEKDLSKESAYTAQNTSLQYYKNVEVDTNYNVYKNYTPTSPNNEGLLSNEYKDTSDVVFQNVNIVHSNVKTNQGFERSRPKRNLNSDDFYEDKEAKIYKDDSTAPNMLKDAITSKEEHIEQNVENKRIDLIKEVTDVLVSNENQFSLNDDLDDETLSTDILDKKLKGAYQNLSQIKTDYLENNPVSMKDNLGIPNVTTDSNNTNAEKFNKNNETHDSRNVTDDSDMITKNDISERVQNLNDDSFLTADIAHSNNETEARDLKEGNLNKENAYSKEVRITPSYTREDNSKSDKKRCLTGYMTDVQSWVDEDGKLTPNVGSLNMIDASRKIGPLLNQEIKQINHRERDIRYISMAKCSLKRVPTIFSITNTKGQALSSMMEYLTLFGNDFSTVSHAGVYFQEVFNATAVQTINNIFKWPATSTWAVGFSSVVLERLKELDLRKCGIQQLTDNIFQNMPRLQALYLGENNIKTITSRSFIGLYSLRHLDLSRNVNDFDDRIMKFEDVNTLSKLENLTSLDLSLTLLRPRDVDVLTKLNAKVNRISLCYTGLTYLPNNIFDGKELMYLDVSGNNGILSNEKAFEGLQLKLEVLYAQEIGLKSFDLFYNFKNLRILNLKGNEINVVSQATTKTLNNLEILDLANNRLITWYEMIFSFMPKLKFLSLRNNNINLISTEMIKDMQNVSYVGLAGNFFVCNCHTRELFEIAYQNQNNDSTFFLPKRPKGNYSFHSGYLDVIKLIKTRSKVTRACNIHKTCLSEGEIESEGKFLFYDFDEAFYQCSSVVEAITMPFSEVYTCKQSRHQNTPYEEIILEGRTKLLFLLIIPGFLFPILIFFYIFRRNLKYFLITMKNSATLSLINNDQVIDDNTLFNYDVFVSYCNEDRDWVLDQLLPNVEHQTNVSVCLHERDFQVGLSILENIVSCMDRSRSIMLVLSQHFLRSQWCQFEMHLAQHRLLETRREDLILVLLEDIPRKMRPTTLHYLMLTKTYIVWPKKENEWPSFWRRLTRSLIARRQNTKGENVSLA